MTNTVDIRLRLQLQNMAFPPSPLLPLPRPLPPPFYLSPALYLPPSTSPPPSTPPPHLPHPPFLQNMSHTVRWEYATFAKIMTNLAVWYKTEKEVTKGYMNSAK